MDGSPGVMRWSLAQAPEGERLTVLREVYGRSFNMELVPLTPDPVLEVELLLLPGLTVMHGRNSPQSVRRTDLSREDDDLLLTWSAMPGKGRMTQLGREVEDGTATLLSCSDPFTAEMRSEFRPVNVRVRRALLAPLLPNAEDAVMRPIPADHPPLRLLRAYLGTLRHEGPPETPELASAVAAHVYDLVALSIGATRDVGTLAAGRGVRAARLAAVKRWTGERLGEPGLSVTRAAAAQGVSARYVQMLFEEAGTTFSAFLLGERLALARRRLASPFTAATPISAVAFDAGFGDLSYFNRAFRARYGCTPSDVRHGVSEGASHPDNPPSRQAKIAPADR